MTKKLPPFLCRQAGSSLVTSKHTLALQIFCKIHHHTPLAVQASRWLHPGAAAP